MFDDSTPIFMQLADQLCAEIVAGTYPDGAKAPSINELAVFHRINPATANRAIALLVERGVLIKRRGIGMFVAEGAHASLVEAGLTTYVDDTLYPAVEAGLVLGLDIGSIADHVRAYTAKTRTKEDS